MVMILLMLVGEMIRYGVAAEMTLYMVAVEMMNCEAVLVMSLFVADMTMII